MPASFRLKIRELRSGFAALFFAGLVAFSPHMAGAQTAPIAIVPIEGVQLTGALNVADGKAMISTSGSVTAGDHAATIALPHRGSLRICATTKVNLTSDSSVPAAKPEAVTSPAVPAQPGLMMALDRGALEANFATGQNSDVILTPDFRILISGPGTAAVQVRLGEKGDTCVDNRGPNAPYVTVSSIFDGGVYRVQPDQRVMFEHGSLREVVDSEKESCGCPQEAPAPMLQGNAFPVAQSEGLAPLPAPPPNATEKGVVHAKATVQLNREDAAAEAMAAPVPPVPVTVAPAVNSPAKAGFFSRVGHFFKKLFGG
jgi:hypothetical protein